MIYFVYPKICYYKQSSTLSKQLVKMSVVTPTKLTLDIPEFPQYIPCALPFESKIESGSTFKFIVSLKDIAYEIKNMSDYHEEIVVNLTPLMTTKTIKELINTSKVKLVIFERDDFIKWAIAKRNAKDTREENMPKGG